MVVIFMLQRSGIGAQKQYHPCVNKSDFFNPVVAGDSCVGVDFGVLVKQLMPLLKRAEANTTHREDCYGKSNTRSKNPAMLNHRDE
jgi:hypothetical protein